MEPNRALSETPPPPSKLRRWSRQAGQWILFLLLIVVLQTGLGRLRAPSLPPDAPDFHLLDLEGRTIALADFAGQTVVLNFWATWCGPCRMEIPSFSKFARQNPQIPVLGIAIDGAPEELRSAREKLGISYPVLRADAQTLEAYGISGVPTTVVVGGNGQVRSAHVGPLFRPHLWWMTR